MRLLKTIPAAMDKYLAGPTSDGRKRAMLEMKEIDIAAFKLGYAGDV